MVQITVLLKFNWFEIILIWFENYGFCILLNWINISISQVKVQHKISNMRFAAERTSRRSASNPNSFCAEL